MCSFFHLEYAFFIFIYGIFLDSVRIFKEFMCKEIVLLLNKAYLTLMMKKNKKIQLLTCYALFSTVLSSEKHDCRLMWHIAKGLEGDE